MTQPAATLYCLHSILLVSIVTLSPARSYGVPAPAGPEPTSRVERVIVVFKTHFDIGYTGLASEIVARYRTSMVGLKLFTPASFQIRQQD